MKIRSSVLFVVFLFLSLCHFNLSVFAQKAPMIYGKINKADLEMKVYPLDTSAVAVILCSYGYYSANMSQFVWDMRIKILKKEGTHWGDLVFPVDSKSDAKGCTFNLENGQVVESKLKSESIFKERIMDDYSRLRVAMPNVKEGSIIDIELAFRGLPRTWKFQDEIPVMWSELIIEPSRSFNLNKKLTGFEPLTEISETRWVAKNMPAFKKEPYMGDVSNYITKFDFEFGGYYSNSWESINVALYRFERFGGALSGDYYLRNVAKEIEMNYPDTLDRIKAALKEIKKIKWNEQKSLFASVGNLAWVYDKKVGNSADINMILIQLLKKLKLKAFPLAISTRDNGLLPLATPTISKFNYLLAYTKVANKHLLIDATEELMPLGLLPQRCMNFRGRILDEDKSEWVEIETDKKNRQVIQYDLKLETDNQITGKLHYTRFDYAAFDFRKAYEKFNNNTEEYLKDFENNHKGISVISASIKNLDSIYSPIEDEYNVKIKNVVSNAGNMVYINPMFYNRIYENPFKVEERKFPVDFIYPTELIYICKISFPEGYKISEMPKPLIIRLPNNTASCMYQIATQDNVLQVTYKYFISKPLFNEKEYADLRAFFSEVVKKHSETIVLTSNSQ